MDFWVLLGTLGTSMLGNMLTGKGVMGVENGYNKIDKNFILALFLKQYWDC